MTIPDEVLVWAGLGLALVYALGPRHRAHRRRVVAHSADRFVPSAVPTAILPGGDAPAPMTQGKPDMPGADRTAGVLIRPPVLFIAALAGGLAIDALVWPASLVPLLTRPGTLALGGFLVLGGCAMMAAAMDRFRRAATPVPTWQPTRALVTGGPYRFTRNPIYLGLTLTHAGIACLADAPAALAVLPGVLVVLHYGVVLHEERYLAARFGADYAVWRARVRRWL